MVSAIAVNYLSEFWHHTLNFFLQRSPVVYCISAFAVLVIALAEQNFRLTCTIEEVRRRNVRAVTDMELYVDRKCEDLHHKCWVNLNTIHESMVLAKAVGDRVTLLAERVEEIVDNDLAQIRSELEYFKAQNVNRKEDFNLLAKRLTDNIIHVKTLIATDRIETGKLRTEIDAMQKWMVRVGAAMKELIAAHQSVVAIRQAEKEQHHQSSAAVISEKEVERVTTIILEHVENNMSEAEVFSDREVDRVTTIILEHVEKFMNDFVIETRRSTSGVTSSPATDGTLRALTGTTRNNILATSTPVRSYCLYPMNTTSLRFDFTANKGEFHSTKCDLDMLTLTQLDQMRAVTSLDITLPNVSYDLDVAKLQQSHPRVVARINETSASSAHWFDSAEDKLKFVLLRNKMQTVTVRVIMTDLGEDDMKIMDLAGTKSVFGDIVDNVSRMLRALTDFTMLPGHKLMTQLTIVFASKEIDGVLGLKFYRDVELYFASPEMQMLVNFCSAHAIDLVIRREEETSTTTAVLYERRHHHNHQSQHNQHHESVGKVATVQQIVDSGAIHADVRDWFGKLPAHMRSRISAPVSRRISFAHPEVEEGEILDDSGAEESDEGDCSASEESHLACEGGHYISEDDEDDEDEDQDQNQHQDQNATLHEDDDYEITRLMDAARALSPILFNEEQDCGTVSF